METKHTPQLPDLESAPTNDTAALTCYALDWRELSHEFKAERDRLKAVNAELVAALQDALKDLSALAQWDIASACAMKARTALAKAKGE